VPDEKDTKIKELEAQLEA